MTKQPNNKKPGKKHEKQENIPGTGSNDAVQRGKKAIEGRAIATGKSKTGARSEEEKKDAEKWRNEG
jgi:hypothetical protein